MTKYKKPDFTEDDLGINPFLNSLIVHVNKVSSEDKYRQEGNDWYKADYEYDAATYTKVFNASKNRLLMTSLSPRGKDLYLWLIYEADKGKDYIWFNRERYMDESGVKAPNTVSDALKELIKVSIVQKSVKPSVLWLNPNYFFNGNRIKAFPDNVKVK